ncbi:hypothetical protein SLEP1_g44518 [Rubroshorea leprosula]|uniref:Uncharacterized protein n=1 Tax=Rubroshorea leprosula TaxID=152421 RepID=A0AAV5LGV3_9ROSI|nr:hypothetical protein SLEP1_g44518 [Rubroshorea leprosula]
MDGACAGLVYKRAMEKGVGLRKPRFGKEEEGRRRDGFEGLRKRKGRRRQLFSVWRSFQYPAPASASSVPQTVEVFHALS